MELLLLIIVIVGIIVLVILTFKASTTITKPPTISTISQVEKCSPALDTLPDVTDLACCITDGEQTLNKYWQVNNIVISPIASNYFQACSGFCLYGVENGRCVSGIGQFEYSQCLELSRPKNCIGIAQPVAKTGITYYYTKAVGSSSCLNRSICF